MIQERGIQFYGSSNDLNFHLLSCGVSSSPEPVVESLFSRILKTFPTLYLANAVTNVGDPLLPGAK